jgi:hypothetical protein
MASPQRAEAIRRSTTRPPPSIAGCHIPVKTLVSDPPTCFGIRELSLGVTRSSASVAPSTRRDIHERIGSSGAHEHVTSRVVSHLLRARRTNELVELALRMGVA